MEPLQCILPESSSSSPWCSHIEDPQVHREALDATLGYLDNQSAFAWYYQWSTTGVSDATLPEIYSYLETFAHNRDTRAIQEIAFAFSGVDLEELLRRIVCQGNLQTVKYLVETFDLPTEEALRRAIRCGTLEIVAYLQDPFPEEGIPHEWNH